MKIKSIKKALKININNFINLSERNINNILHFLKLDIIILIEKCKKIRVYNI